MRIRSSAFDDAEFRAWGYEDTFDAGNGCNQGKSLFGA
jgi:hypothetical protein